MKADDNDYTHSAGFEFINDYGTYLKLGQNMYAPSNLKRKDYIKEDRPYAGNKIYSIVYVFKHPSICN